VSELPFDKKKVTVFSIVGSVAVALIFLFLKKWAWSLGIMLGTGAGLWNFYLLYKDFAGMFSPPSDQAARREMALPSQGRLRQLSMVSKFFFRYLFLAVLFFAAFKIPGVHFVGFVLGFFLVHVNLAIVSFLRFMRPEKN